LAGEKKSMLCLERPLKFECGVHGEFTVDGWQAVRTK
jgi:hypothetical protein